MPAHPIVALVGLLLPLLFPGAARAHAPTGSVNLNTERAATAHAPDGSVRLGTERHVRVGVPFGVGIDYTFESARRLLVVVAPGTTCAARPDLFAGPRPRQRVADLSAVSGYGVFVGMAVPDAWGMSIACAYTAPPGLGDQPGWELVETGAPIQAGAPARRCDDVGGPRGIVDVSVGGVSCARGRSVARRWGRARRAPELVGGFECRRVRGRAVRCTYGVNELEYGVVRFRYRR